VERNQKAGAREGEREPEKKLRKYRLQEKIVRNSDFSLWEGLVALLQDAHRTKKRGKNRPTWGWQRPTEWTGKNRPPPTKTNKERRNNSGMAEGSEKAEDTECNGIT